MFQDNSLYESALCPCGLLIWLSITELPGGMNFGLKNVLCMKDVEHMSYRVAMTVPITDACSRDSIS